ncbi:MAG: hypothetical protein M3007_07500 [Candidatus Eremiobacteraeota bacterium]|nr:hypothetical protein [Candidatus Eremiobacteraeota bacterium]
MGIANGLSYLAGLRIVQEIAPPDHRAEVTSAFLVASYSGFSLPALAVGFAANFIGLYPALVVAAIALGVIAFNGDRTDDRPQFESADSRGNLEQSAVPMNRQAHPRYRL